MRGAVDIALAAAAGRIEDEGGCVEAGGGAAGVQLEVLRGGDRGAQVFDAGHHVVNVHVIRMHVHEAEPTDKELHGGRIVVDGALEHGLAADMDAALGEHVHGVVRDAGDLGGVIEVRVDDDVLVQAAAELDDVGERISPGVIAEDFLRQHAEAFRGVADAANVRHAQEPLADESMRGAEIVAVAAADDDVFEVG